MAEDGDAARVDDEGYLWIVDRVGDRFISDGHAVYPGDVERALMDHPAVADAGVVGLLAEGGEVCVAFVVMSGAATATEDELLAFCREHLAPHQVPASVTFLDLLPRNSVGKLIRQQLRSLARSDSAP